METHYYYILDLKQLAKIENCIAYLFSPGKGWIPDGRNVLMDRILENPNDSAMGASMLLLVEEISEAKARSLMAPSASVC